MESPVPMSHALGQVYCNGRSHPFSPAEPQPIQALIEEVRDGLGLQPHEPLVLAELTSVYTDVVIDEDLADKIDQLKARIFSPISSPRTPLHGARGHASSTSPATSSPRAHAHSPRGSERAHHCSRKNTPPPVDNPRYRPRSSSPASPEPIEKQFQLVQELQRHNEQLLRQNEALMQRVLQQGEEHRAQLEASRQENADRAVHHEHQIANLTLQIRELARRPHISEDTLATFRRQNRLLRAKDAQIAELQHANGDLQQRLGELIEGSRQKIQELTSQLEQKTAALAELEQQHREALSASAEKDRTIASQSRLISGYQQALQEAEATLTEKAHQLEEAREQCRDLGQALQRAYGENSQLRSTLTEKLHALGEAEEYIRELRGDNQTLAQSLQGAIAQLEENDHQIEELEEGLESLNDALRDLISEKSQQVQELTAALRETREELEEAAAHAEQVIQGKDAEIEEQEQANAELREQLRRQEEEASQERLHSLASLGEVASERDTAGARAARLETELAQAQAELEAARRKNVQNQEEMQSLCERLAASEAALEESQERLTQFIDANKTVNALQRGELQRLRKELQEAQSTGAQSAEDAGAERARAHELQLALTESEEALAAARAAKDRSAEEVQGLSGRVRELEQQLAAQGADLDGINDLLGGSSSGKKRAQAPEPGKGAAPGADGHGGAAENPLHARLREILGENDRLTKALERALANSRELESSLSALEPQVQAKYQQAEEMEKALEEAVDGLGFTAIGDFNQNLTTLVLHIHELRQEVEYQRGISQLKDKDLRELRAQMHGLESRVAHLEPLASAVERLTELARKIQEAVEADPDPDLTDTQRVEAILDYLNPLLIEKEALERKVRELEQKLASKSTDEDDPISKKLTEMSQAARARAAQVIENSKTLRLLKTTRDEKRALEEEVERLQAQLKEAKAVKDEPAAMAAAAPVARDSKELEDARARIKELESQLISADQIDLRQELDRMRYAASAKYLGQIQSLQGDIRDLQIELKQAKDKHFSLNDTRKDLQAAREKYDQAREKLEQEKALSDRIHKEQMQAEQVAAQRRNLEQTRTISELQSALRAHESALRALRREKQAKAAAAAAAASAPKGPLLELNEEESLEQMGQLSFWAKKARVPTPKIKNRYDGEELHNALIPLIRKCGDDWEAELARKSGSSSDSDS